MKNSSTGSSLLARVDRSSEIILFSTAGSLQGLCPATTVLLSQPFLAAQPAGTHFPEEPCRWKCVCGKHSISSLARASADDAPTAAGLSELRGSRRSVEADRQIVLTDVAEDVSEMGTPVSTLVSSSSSSRRRWERDRAMEGCRGESWLLVVEDGAGLLRCEE